jgi:hypothetical protein
MAGIPLRGGWGGSNQSLTGLALPGAVPAMPGRTQPPYYGQYDPNQHTLVFGPTTHRIYDYSTSPEYCRAVRAALQQCNVS